jgi:hypothetical protein
MSPERTELSVLRTDTLEVNRTAELVLCAVKPGVEAPE